MSKHNKDNQPQEYFVRSPNEWEQSVVFGGYWIDTSFSGSRASSWNGDPSNSSNNVSARGVCDHRIK